MNELRQHPRVAAHYPLTLRQAQWEARGTTENLSARGLMLSLESDRSLKVGEHCELSIELPVVGPIIVHGTLRWTSSVVRGLVGVEFVGGVPAEIAAQVAQLLDAQDPG